MVPVPDRNVNVLFTSAGRRVELLRAFAAAFSRLGVRGRIVVTDIDPLAPTFREADSCHIVPTFSSPEYIPSLVEVCEQEQVHLVFPLIDPDIPLLAGARAAFESVGALPMVVSEDMARVAADKWETLQLFARLQVPAPESWLPDEVDSTSLPYPVFIKPRRGSAAKDAFVVRDPREFVFFSKYVEDPIVQQFLPGPEITSDVTCDPDGRVLAVVSRQRLEVRSGEVSKGMTIFDPRIHALCVRIAEGMQAVGPITIQCMMMDGEPRFTEVNARFGGGAPLGFAAGVDAPAMLLAAVAGIPWPPLPPGAYARGLYMTRFDDSFVLTEEEHAALVRHRIRSR